MFVRKVEFNKVDFELLCMDEWYMYVGLNFKGLFMFKLLYNIEY